MEDFLKPKNKIFKDKGKSDLVSLLLFLLIVVLLSSLFISTSSFDAHLKDIKNDPLNDGVYIVSKVERRIEKGNLTIRKNVVPEPNDLKNAFLDKELTTYYSLDRFYKNSGVIKGFEDKKVIFLPNFYDQKYYFETSSDMMELEVSFFNSKRIVKESDEELYTFQKDLHLKEFINIRPRSLFGYEKIYYPYSLFLKFLDSTTNGYGQKRSDILYDETHRKRIADGYRYVVTDGVLSTYYNLGEGELKLSRNSDFDYEMMNNFFYIVKFISYTSVFLLLFSFCLAHLLLYLNIVLKERKKLGLVRFYSKNITEAFLHFDGEHVLFNAVLSCFTIFIYEFLLRFNLRFIVFNSILIDMIDLKIFSLIVLTSTLFFVLSRFTVFILSNGSSIWNQLKESL
jgi:hypothetical protein